MSDNFGETTLTNHDQPNDVVDKVNALLKEQGMQFVEVEEESRDGAVVYRLTIA